MTSGLVLKLLLFAVVPGVLGYVIRKSMPRLASFFMGIPMSLLGLWAVLSTLELAEKNMAHTFSRHNTVFSRAASPESFEWSFWFHLCLGALILLLGVGAMLLPLTPLGSRIKFDR